MLHVSLGVDLDGIIRLGRQVRGDREVKLTFDVYETFENRRDDGRDGKKDRGLGFEKPVRSGVHLMPALGSEFWRQARSLVW